MSLKTEFLLGGITNSQQGSPLNDVTLWRYSKQDQAIIPSQSHEAKKHEEQ